MTNVSPSTLLAARSSDPRGTDQSLRFRLAAAAICLADREEHCQTAGTHPVLQRHAASTYQRVVCLLGVELVLSVHRTGEVLEVSAPAVAAAPALTLRRPQPGARSLWVDGEEILVDGRRRGGAWRLRCGATVASAQVRRGRVANLARIRPPDLYADAHSVLRCPMPGVLTALHCGAGDTVETGQLLATIEAMKMENWLRADRNATVVRALPAIGTSLAANERILEFAAW